jgi:fibronectin type 3 domain-containing protein
VDPPPAPPTGLGATAGDGSVALDWNDNGEADLAGYDVYRGTAAGGPYQKLNSAHVSGSAFTDATATNGTHWFYVVRAADSAGHTSANSNEASATPQSSEPPPPPPPGDPYRTAVMATSGLVSYWRLGETSGTSAVDEVRGNNGHYLGGPTLGLPGASAALGTAVGFDGADDELTVRGNGLTLTTTGSLEGWFRWESGNALLRDSTTTNGWTLAFDQNGSLGYRAGGTTFVTTVPTAGVRDGTWHHLVLTKSRATTGLFIDGIRVHTGSGAANATTAPPWHVMRNGTTTGFSRGRADEIAIYNSALSPTTVAAHHTAGLAGGGGPPDPPPAAPSGLGATAGDGSVALDWSDNGEPDLAGYDVHRATSAGGPYQRLNTAHLTASQFTDSTATNGTRWFYVVRAADSAGHTSADSNEASATPQSADPPPAAPSGLGAAAGDGSVALDWSDNGEADLAGYDVYRGTAAGGPYQKLNTAHLTASQFTDNSATNGTRWFYVVRAADSAGHTSADSNEASATPQSADPPPPPLVNPYRTAVMATSGLVSYWRIGELSGTSALDEVRGNNGNYLGGPMLGLPGAFTRLGTAADFDGVDDELTVRGNGLTLTSTGSIEGWFRWEAGNALLRDSTATNGWTLAFDQNGNLAYRAGGTTFTTTRPVTSVRDGNWHHLVLTKSAGSTGLYVDGTRVHTGSGAANATTAPPWHVMRNGTTAGFSRGRADEVAIYNGALSPTTVAAHYAAATAVP